MSNKDDLIHGHQSQVIHGYQKNLDKYYIEIIDFETNTDTRIYLDKEDFEMFAHSMLNSIRNEKNEDAESIGEREELQ